MRRSVFLIRKFQHRVGNSLTEIAAGRFPGLQRPKYRSIQVQLLYTRRIDNIKFQSFKAFKHFPSCYE